MTAAEFLASSRQANHRDESLLERIRVDVLAEECRYAKAFVYNDCSRFAFMALSLLLFKFGQVRDSLLVARAKACCFDAEALVDAQLICGAGVERTLEFLAAAPESRSLREYLERMRENGELDDVAAHAFGFEQMLRVDHDLSARS